MQTFPVYQLIALTGIVIAGLLILAGVLAHNGPTIERCYVYRHNQARTVAVPVSEADYRRQRAEDEREAQREAQVEASERQRDARAALARRRARVVGRDSEDVETWADRCKRGAGKRCG